jgi:hypothetical protein
MASIDGPSESGQSKGMDMLPWLIDQAGRGLCLGLLASLLWSLAQGLVPIKEAPSHEGIVAHTRARALGSTGVPDGLAPSACVLIRDGWQTTRSEQEPEPQSLLLFDLYVFLRRSWDDGYEARQTTRGLIGGGAGEQPRPKRIVKAARQWSKETGTGGATADRLLDQLIEIGVVAQSVETAHSAGDIGWRLLRPEEAAPLFQREVGVGIERGGAAQSM